MPIQSSHTSRISFKCTRVSRHGKPVWISAVRSKNQYGNLQLKFQHCCHLNSTSADLHESDPEAGPNTGSHDAHLNAHLFPFEHDTVLT